MFVFFLFPFVVQVEGVQDVHDLHVWSLSSSIPILTAHVHITMEAEPDQVSLASTRLHLLHNALHYFHPAVTFNLHAHGG